MKLTKRQFRLSDPIHLNVNELIKLELEIFNSAIPSTVNETS